MAPLNAHILQESFERFAGLVAWEQPGKSRLFRDLRNDVEDLRQRWRRAGVQAGTYAAVYQLEPYDTWLVFLAASLEGVVLAILPSRLALEPLRAYLEQVPFTAWISQHESPRSELLPLPAPTASKAFPLHSESTQRSPVLPDTKLDESLQLDRPCLLVFSSGTSGRPKAIQHSLRSLCRSALGSLEFYKARVGQSSLLSLELSHIGGLQIALRCFLGGLRCLGGFAPAKLDAALQHFQPDYISMVPTQLQRLLEQPELRGRLQACRAILLGGAGSPASLLAAAQRWQLPISVTYGSSETASQVAAFAPGTYPNCPSQVGSLLPGWEARIEAGCLALAGEALCQGWWQEGQFMALKNGPAAAWYRSRDKAALNDSALQILGREDAIFQVAGENLAPAEIIAALASLEVHGDWMVLPQIDGQYGHVPILIFRGQQAPPSREEILPRLRAQLPGIKIPRAFYWHCSDEVAKPSRVYYEGLLQRREQLELQWTL